MNTYIMDALGRIKRDLLANETFTFKTADEITSRLEMIKMEIEQHIANMQKSEKYNNILYHAENAVQKLSEIIDLLEELPYDGTLASEIIELIDDIHY